MKYERPVFGSDVKTRKAYSAFGGPDIALPEFDKPISSKENFYRAARHENPLWVPFPAAEIQDLHMSHLSGKGPEGKQLGPSMNATAARYTYTDDWGNSWTWDRNAGGACMTPGTRVCDDILKWEEQIRFPDFRAWDLEGAAADFLQNRYDPEMALALDLYHGPFQALADLMGGFAEALEAMFVEPEASRAFFDRFAEWEIWQIDRFSALYPADMFIIHDDWGTEKDAFFSPAMMEELLYEPTKRIIDHVHGLGKVYQFHCCGKVDKFLPYFKTLAPEFMQLQRRVNDTPQYKRDYGTVLGFNTGLEGLEPGKKYSDEEIERIVRDNIALFGPTGGFLPAVRSGDPALLWKLNAEIFCCSRELYDQEN